MAKTKVEMSPLASLNDLLTDLDSAQMRQLLDFLFVLGLVPTKKNIQTWRESFLE